MIKLDWTLLVQLAIFLSFIAYLNFMLLRPMGAYLERRKRTIEGMRSTGGEQVQELEQAHGEYSRKIAAAREDLLTQRSAARKEATDIQSSLLEEARKEANDELSRGEAELAGNFAAARSTLESQARALASQISEKILGRACQ